MREIIVNGELSTSLILYNISSTPRPTKMMHSSLIACEIARGPQPSMIESANKAYPPYETLQLLAVLRGLGWL